VDAEDSGSNVLSGDGHVCCGAAALTRQLTVLSLGLSVLTDAWPHGSARELVGTLAETAEQVVSGAVLLVETLLSGTDRAA
jgi:hypothetical protein